ncbi:MAG: glutamate-1-semialdehyde 2,1-aminomutase [Fibrobacterota bacterium]
MPDRVLVVFRSAAAGDRPDIPGWKIVPVVLGEQREIPQAATRLASRLVGRDCLVVTSPRAAEWLARQDLSAGSRLPVFVAGPASATVLTENGWDTRIPAGTGGAEAVALLVDHDFCRPLFVGAVETAGTVEDACQRRGLDLDHLPVYAAAPRADLTESDITASVGDGHIAFLAPSAVRFLRDLSPTLFATLSVTRPAAAAGQATRQILSEYGWNDIRLAPGPDFRSLTASFGGTMNSKELFERAQRVIPGGVHSPVRAFRNVGADPFYVESASGARLKTVDGKELVDWIGSWGPMILGHNLSSVNEAVRRGLETGSSFGACSLPEVLLSEEICRRNPWVEMVRLVSSGTEATMSALRLARGFTGRPAFVKFRGCYHGHADSFLVAAGSGALTHGHPSSPGVTPDTAKDTVIAEFNDLDSVKAAFDGRPGEIACIFVEPIPGNMGLIPPAPGFLEGLRALCDRHGALLILDEVMTGFRVGPSGAAGLLNIKPDLATYGKIIGGGLPLAAFGGRRDIMEKLSPIGPVYQAGTLSGNPLACAAGLALLQELTPAVYERLEELGARLEKQVLGGIEGKPLCFQRIGSMATLFFHAGPVRTYADVAACDNATYGRFFRKMLERGHFLPPAQFEAFFVSSAHSQADIERLATDMISCATESLREVG